MKYWHIFLAFFRAGIFGYGGGPSSIPLFHKEVVDNYKWMSTDEFGDIVALANALPGPIATKMAGYIGYRVGGMRGMFIALFANVVPTIILMILFLTILYKYKDKPWVKGMGEAVIPVVGVLLGTLTWDFVKKSSTTLGWAISIIFIIISVVLLQLLQIHPAIIIGALLISAFFKKDAKKGKHLS